VDATYKIIVTGAAGLVRQHLVLLLREAGYRRIVAIDKRQENRDLLARDAARRVRGRNEVFEPDRAEQRLVVGVNSLHQPLLLRRSRPPCSPIRQAASMGISTVCKNVSLVNSLDFSFED
jgi:NAD(P)-dependent dehydrogenase (short-subunit alcohol dehydrogenase family)